MFGPIGELDSVPQPMERQHCAILKRTDTSNAGMFTSGTDRDTDTAHLGGGYGFRGADGGHTPHGGQEK